MVLTEVVLTEVVRCEAVPTGVDQNEVARTWVARCEVDHPVAAGLRGLQTCAAADPSLLPNLRGGRSPKSFLGGLDSRGSRDSKLLRLRRRRAVPSSRSPFRPGRRCGTLNDRPLDHGGGATTGGGGGSSIGSASFSSAADAWVRSVPVRTASWARSAAPALPVWLPRARLLRAPIASVSVPRAPLRRRSAPPPASASRHARARCERRPECRPSPRRRLPSGSLLP